MAITIAAAGLFMGLLYKQKRTQMIWLTGLGAMIALLANVPRLMLVTIAHVYWGEWWFTFGTASGADKFFQGFSSRFITMPS